jgi:hypothetical protein
MKVTITGRPKHVSKKIAKEALEFFASILMTKRLTKTLSVEIKFVKDLRQSEFGRKYGADKTDWAIMDYEHHWTESRLPKQFIFEISNDIRTEQKLLELLAHEMVHVEQYARGRLDYTRKHYDIKRWEKKEYDTRKKPYWLWPWEVEAYGKEIGLVSMFLEHNAERLNLPLTQQGLPTKKDWKAK